MLPCASPTYFASFRMSGLGCGVECWSLESRRARNGILDFARLRPHSLRMTNANINIQDDDEHRMRPEEAGRLERAWGRPLHTKSRGVCASHCASHRVKSADKPVHATTCVNHTGNGSYWEL